MNPIAFDLDGTLLDSEPIFIEAAKRLLAIRGVAFDPDFMTRIMGQPGRVVLPAFREHFGLTESVESVGDDYRKFFYEAANGSVALLPGARELVTRLHEQNRPLALVTSSRRHYVDLVFHPHGFLDRFVHVITADDVNNGKPDPEPYLLAATRFGVTPDKIIVLEDSPAGVRSAKAAGCYCIAVPQKHVPREAVTHADVVFSTLLDEELTGYLELLRPVN